MAAVKKKKGLMYKGKPLLRCGNRIYYGNLEDKLILALDIVESSKKQDVDVSTESEGSRLWTTQASLAKVRFIVSAKGENLYKAIDIGEWWLQDAMKMMGSIKFGKLLHFYVTAYLHL